MCIVYLHNHLPFSPSLGKPVMIITEYMENGSLDAFLRVSHAFLFCTRVRARSQTCARYVCGVLIPSYLCNVIPQITSVHSLTFALISILPLDRLTFFPSTKRLAQVSPSCFEGLVHFGLQMTCSEIIQRTCESHWLQKEKETHGLKKITSIYGYKSPVALCFYILIHYNYVIKHLLQCHTHHITV